MNDTIGWLLLSAVLAGAFIGFAHRLCRPDQVRLFSVSLFLGGLIYLVPGTFHGIRWVALKGADALLFSLLAWGRSAVAPRIGVRVDIAPGSRTRR